MRFAKSGRAALGTAALLIATSACGSSATEVNHLDGPTYSSLEQLTANSEVIVTGNFGEIVRTVTERDLIGEDGGFLGNDDGLALDLWTFTVSSTIKGDRDLSGDEILVTQITADDSTEPGVDGAVYTAAAERPSVLFLRPYKHGKTHAVLGLGVGSLEVTGDGLVAPEGADEGLVADLAEFEDTAAALREVSAITDRAQRN